MVVVHGTPSHARYSHGAVTTEDVADVGQYIKALDSKQRAQNRHHLIVGPHGVHAGLALARYLEQQHMR